MSTHAVPYLTPEQYLEIEEANQFRSEYIDGGMFAMAGATRNHGRVVGNAFAILREQLRGRRCEAASTDLRVYCPEGRMFTYPDVVVTCGPDMFLDNRRDTITDATMIVEVLSPSTCNYDRGEKFRYYRSLASFCEYLILAQDEFRAEHHVRQPDGSWLFREYTSPATQIELKSIDCHLHLESLYDRVEFPAEA
jgi:Uma2 family endonuclease